jgi:hypothetical protein
MEFLLYTQCNNISVNFPVDASSNWNRQNADDYGLYELEQWKRKMHNFVTILEFHQCIFCNKYKWTILYSIFVAILLNVYRTPLSGPIYGSKRGTFYTT